MYKLFMTAVFVVLAALPVSAQTFVENQNMVTANGWTPTLDAQLEIAGKKANFVGWFLVSEGWGEALIGVSKSPRPWLWFSATAGVETAKRPWRVSPSVWVGNNRVSFFTTVEYGGSGLWYKSTGLVRVAPRLELGYHTQRFYGTGPMIKVTLGRKLAVWGSYTNERKSIVGVSKTF